MGTSKKPNCDFSGLSYNFSLGRLTVSRFFCRNSETTGARTSGVLRWAWWSPGTVTTVCWNQGRQEEGLAESRSAGRTLCCCRGRLTSLARRNWRSVEVNLLWDGSERLLPEPSRALGGIKHALGYWYWELCLQGRSSGNILDKINMKLNRTY